MLLAALTGCDAPRDRRSYLNNNNLLTSGNANSGITDNTNNSSTSNNTSTSTSTSTTVATNFPTDVNTNCTFSADGVNGYMNSSAHAGSYSMCKSKSNDNVVYFELKTTPTDNSGNSVQMCFIPMTTSNGNSIYIGNPMCGYFNNATSVKQITFTKYSQYSNATLSGVLFFKDTSYYYSAFGAYTNTLTAFQACMNALYYGNTTYCNSFKATGQYVFQNF